MGRKMKQKENDVVVLLSHMRWDSPCDYIKQTASELGKKTSVVIFNPLAPLTLKNLIFDPERRKNRKNIQSLCWLSFPNS